LSPPRHAAIQNVKISAANTSRMRSNVAHVVRLQVGDWKSAPTPHTVSISVNQSARWNCGSWQGLRCQSVTVEVCGAALRVCTMFRPRSGNHPRNARQRAPTACHALRWFTRFHQRLAFLALAVAVRQPGEA
jgi:hypothetical protein